MADHNESLLQELDFVFKMFIDRGYSLQDLWTHAFGLVLTIAQEHGVSREKMVEMVDGYYTIAEQEKTHG